MIKMKETSEYTVSEFDDKRRRWQKRTFGAITNSEKDRVLFVGVRGCTGFGGVAIDNIIVSKSSCLQPTEAPSEY